MHARPQSDSRPHPRAATSPCPNHLRRPHFRGRPLCQIPSRRFTSPCRYPFRHAWHIPARVPLPRRAGFADGRRTRFRSGVPQLNSFSKLGVKGPSSKPCRSKANTGFFRDRRFQIMECNDSRMPKGFESRRVAPTEDRWGTGIRGSLHETPQQHRGNQQSCHSFRGRTGLHGKMATPRYDGGQNVILAPRERFELPRSETSGFRDRRHTGLGYLGLGSEHTSRI